MTATTTASSRDGAIIGLVGVAHYFSHLMQLALPPLFLILHAEFAVSYTELGLIVTLFYVASGVGQAGAGVLVDRFGAPPLLTGGLAAISLGTLLAGLAMSYWMFLPLAVLAGLGNSVFHPADLSILSHRVNEKRLGRAFAAHGLTGVLGYASSPVVVTSIAAFAGWRAALIAIGAAGLVVALLIHLNRRLLDYPGRHAAEATAHRAGPRPTYWSVIGSPVIIMAFAYFTLTAFAGNGLQAFGITAFTSGYGLSMSAATMCLTSFLVANVLGMMAGGFLAERTERHDYVAMFGIAAGSAFMLLVTATPAIVAVILPAMGIAGFAYGLTAPSRDVLVRRSAVGVGMGSVFGFVYSGFDIGSAVAPLLLGAMIDRHLPRVVFLILAVAFALAAPSVMQFRRPRTRPAPRLSPAE